MAVAGEKELLHREEILGTMYHEVGVGNHLNHGHTM